MLITSSHTIDLSPSIRKKGFRQRKVSSSNTHFKQALYRNSRVHRITLGSQLRESKIKANTWHSIDLKLVTELGLPAQLPNSDEFPVSCQLLQLRHGQYYACSQANSIECRLSAEEETDSWCQQTSAPLSMVNDADDSFSFQTLPLPRDGHYILFQELWDNGTPGKLWDSALVMNHVFNTLAEVDKHYLSGRRIMDLSAGIGAIGLTIVQTSRINNIPNPPHIVMTDLEEALPLMKSNQQLNNIPNTEHVSIQRLAWGSSYDINHVLQGSHRPFDFILISDVLYNTRDFPALISTFRQLVEKNRHSVIIMGYKPRGLKQSEEDLFFNECRSHLRLETLDLESFAREFFDNSPSTDKKVAFLKKSKLLQLTGVCLYKITHKKSKYRMIHHLSNSSSNTPLYKL
ncbi:putative methyltransferase-domain-containing protein [Mucor lusitanicus]|uniref:Putative methyltransferase-domain-containing protein n=1 Tax=Mucor circinelloides f. lusitanicus TaxID=29924 RepID=A0A8H4BHX4_MUCCL|nr:putative methyltransferase-domain-containing protein [Mucor lusitanicus]